MGSHDYPIPWMAFVRIVQLSGCLSSMPYLWIFSKMLAHIDSFEWEEEITGCSIAGKIES